jgi:hypothetical protein
MSSNLSQRDGLDRILVIQQTVGTSESALNSKQNSGSVIHDLRNVGNANTCI